MTENTAMAKTAKICRILLLLIIIAQTVYMCLCFAFERKGIFSDEVWSFGLSNSYYKPFIYAPDGYRANYIDDHDLNDNFNEVVDGSELKDYITVQKGQRFSYGSVYHNQTLDCHPVLYYAMLHTVCSFFPDRFSLLFAFIPSLIFMWVTQFFLYRLGKLLTGSEVYALTAVLFYAAVPGALFTFIYIRMYSLLTMLLVMNTFYTMRYIYDGEMKTVKALLPVYITAFLAFNTQYSAIAYIGFLTFAVCVWLIVKRGFLQAVRYGLLMAATLGAFVGVFPAMLDHIFNNQFTGEKQYDFFTQLRAILDYVTKYSLGFRVYMLRSDKGAYITAVLVIVIAVAAPVLFLFRDSAAVKNAAKALREKMTEAGNLLRSSHYGPVMIMFGVAGIIIFANLSCDIAYTLKTSLRYVMPAYPFACLAAVILLKGIIGQLPLIRRASLPVLLAVVAVMAFRSNLQNRKLFMFSAYPVTVTEAADTFEGTKNIVIIPDKRMIMTNTCAYLYKCDKVYYVTAKELKEDNSAAKNAFDSPDYVWAEWDNYLLTDRQADMIVEKGLVPEKKKYQLQTRNILVDDPPPDWYVARLVTEEVDDIIGDDPDIEYMIEANGRSFFILKRRAT